MSTPDDNEPNTVHVQWHDWPIYDYLKSRGRSDFRPWRLRTNPAFGDQNTDFIPIVPVQSAGCKKCVSETGAHGMDCTRTPHCDGVVWMDARDPEALVKYITWRMSNDQT